MSKLTAPILSSHHRPAMRPKGFALLLAMFVLLLATLGLLAIGQLSLRQALAADQQEQDLQTKWSILGCQRTLLPRCEKVLADQEIRTNTPTTECRSSLTLNDRSIRLIFSDEQAKVNVNALLRRKGKQDTQSDLWSLLSGSGMAGHLHLTPESMQTASANSKPDSARQVISLTGNKVQESLSGYGSLFNEIAPAELVDKQIGPNAPVANITCWGDSHLNCMRASEKALRATLLPEMDLNSVAKIIVARSANPPPSLDALIDSLSLTGTQRAVAGERLTANSKCHGLWIITHSGGSDRYYHVVEDTSRGNTFTYAFQW